MKKDLIIIGAGSVGGHVASNLKDYSTKYSLLGFLDDNETKIGESFVGYSVLGDIDSIINYPTSISIIIGIAFPKIKFDIIKRLRELGFNNYPSLVSSNAWISKDTEIGEGCIFYPNTTINYNCIIDDFVVINMNCVIGHGCRIGDYSSLAPGVMIGGNTTIGQLSEMGIGSQTIQELIIGHKCTVGAGAVVIKDISDSSIKKYGFTLDTCYTAKAFYGMKEYIKNNNIKGEILFWHTGGIFNFLAQ